MKIEIVFLIASIQTCLLKVTQINYLSRNQLHSTENLNFGLMGKKAKHCWALSTNFSVQLIVFLGQVLLLAELTQKLKFLHKSCMAKLFHETEQWGISL